MEDVLCNISAFRYHRVPPQVLMLLPMIPTAELDPNRVAFVAHPLVAEVLGAPVHLLADESGRSSRGDRIVKHVLKGELPFGSIQKSVLGIGVTSPCLTLLSMATSVSEERLAMAIYEFCGPFTVFEPGDFLEDLLACAYSEKLLDESFGWERCVDVKGNTGTLWSRPPLIELHELEEFVQSCANMRGVKRLAKAMKLVTGIAASPFEVQSSLLLGTSVRCGGEGFAVQNNVEIVLDRDSRNISGTGKRIADILIVSDDGEMEVIVECQSQAFHSSAEAIESDADRTTALQAMGYDVILLTFKQIHDPDSFATVVELIREKLGMGPRHKTARQIEREMQLREEVFCDWELF